MDIVVREAELIEPRKFRIKIKRRGLKEYEISDEGLLILKYANREKGITEPCPFCYTKGHIHGTGGGHRGAHCAGKFEINLSNGEKLYSCQGYILKGDNQTAIGGCKSLQPIDL